MMKGLAHFRTINHHKTLVMKHCFKVGLYKQGLLHDLSKYSLTEFLVGARYFQGTRSPNNAEREDKGYSSAWLHHKGRNKHHLEYWIDYGPDGEGSPMVGMKMPVCYVVEMFCDRVAASKTYNPTTYRDDFPLQYFEKSVKHYLIHPDTEKLLRSLLTMLAEKGEEETFSYIKNEIVRNKSFKY